jgi:hypothetical protein
MPVGHMTSCCLAGKRLLITMMGLVGMLAEALIMFPVCYLLHCQ